MRKIAAVMTIVGTLIASRSAYAAISSVLNGTVSYTVQTGADAGERHCAGIFTSFDGAPIDVNIGFPSAPASGPDGSFPIIVSLLGENRKANVREGALDEAASRQLPFRPRVMYWADRHTSRSTGATFRRASRWSKREFGHAGGPSPLSFGVAPTAMSQIEASRFRSPFSGAPSEVRPPPDLAG